MVDKLDEIISRQDTIIGQTSRAGLYLMVAFGAIHSCNAPGIDEIEELTNAQNYETCLNQQELQNQQAQIYNRSTGGDYFVDFPNAKLIDCSKYASGD